VPLVGWLVGWAVSTIGAGALVLLVMGKTERPAAILAASGQMPSPQPMTPNFPQPSH
jgi:hypothetical protein